MRIGSLCTGILGLDRAVAQHFGAELAWYSEIEPAAISVIEREHPGVPNLGDLKAIDWAQVEPVDILTAGYPCQPFSHAGKRKGTDDPRHLWPWIAEAVRRLRPRYVVLENVRGHLSKGFDVVLGSLAEAGFDAEWCVLRASDVGACHQRARVFIVATDADRVAGAMGEQGAQPGAERLRRLGAAGNGRTTVADAEGEQQPRRASGDAPAPLGLTAVGAGVGDRTRCASTGVRGLERDPRVEWGKYAPAVERHAACFGRPAPSPVDDGGRLAPAFVEWMMGYPEGWVSGLGRTAALKALGNAVVTQQALAALRELCPMGEEAKGSPITKVPALLGTPTAHPRTHAPRPVDHGIQLANQIRDLLPTPVVNDMGEGKTPERWDEWTDEMKAKHGNGNGHGRSLAIEAQRVASA